MQKLFPSVADRMPAPADSGEESAPTQELPTVRLRVLPPAAPTPAVLSPAASMAASMAASVADADDEDASADTRPMVWGGPVAQPLVWPPSEEELDDWHVIALRHPDPTLPAPATESQPPVPIADWQPPVPAAASQPPPATTIAPRPPPAAPEPPPVHVVARQAPADLRPPPANARPATATSSTDANGFADPDEPTAPIEIARLLEASRPIAPAPAAPVVTAPPAPAVQASAVTEPTDDHEPTDDAPTDDESDTRPASLLRRAAVILLALLAVGQSAYIGARLLFTPQPPSIVVVQSSPTAAAVLIDGRPRGETPLKLELLPGDYRLELRKDGAVRTLPLVIAAGVQASQYIELGAPPSSSPAPAAPLVNVPPAASTGSPASAAHLASAPRSAPGRALDSPTSAADPEPPLAPTRGWLVVQSPLNLSVLLHGELVGNTERGRLSLPAGRHELELMHHGVGYRAVTMVTVPPGREVILPIVLPQSVLNVTSTPTARVWIDGREFGDTPLREITLPIGPHDVLFRHPQLGERRVTVFVRVGATALASVEF